MKKTFFVLLPLIMLIFARAAVAAPMLDKEGRYVLKNAEQLKWFRNEVNKGRSELNAILDADIDLGGQSWVPIGATEQTPYNGSFNGDGHLIRDFSARCGVALGLFGYADFGSSITDLRIENVIIAFDGDNIVFAAALAAVARGIIQNCSVAKSEIHIAVSKNLPSTIYGGVIAGINEEGVILDCLSTHNRVRLDNKYQNDEIAAAGGICGGNVGTIRGVGLIMNCKSVSNEVFLTIGDSQMHGAGGGIVGLALGGIIRQSQVQGGRLDTKDFSGNHSSLGGIIGYSMLGSYTENCSVTGDLLIHAEGGSTESNLGAIAGDLIGSNVSGCSVNNVIISANGNLPHNLGGVAGVFAGGWISDCRITGLLPSRDKEGFFNIGAIAGVAMDMEIMGSLTEAIIENTFFQSFIAGGVALGINETSSEVGAFPFDVTLSPDLRQ